MARGPLPAREAAETQGAECAVFSPEGARSQRSLLASGFPPER